MKCYRQPPYLAGKPTPIEDLWEVHLASTIWEKITSLAMKQKVSYSTIARYCIFRFVEQKDLKMEKKYVVLHKQNKMHLNRAKTIHRHLVCLYGEDVVLLRLTAMRLKISVSALIRLALALYLPRLAMENHSSEVTPEELFYLGIKRWLRIELTELHMHGLPVIHQFTFSMFLPWQWWS